MKRADMRADERALYAIRAAGRHAFHVGRILDVPPAPRLIRVTICDDAYLSGDEDHLAYRIAAADSLTATWVDGRAATNEIVPLADWVNAYLLSQRDARRRAREARDAADRERTIRYGRALAVAGLVELVENPSGAAQPWRRESHGETFARSYADHPYGERADALAIYEAWAADREKLRNTLLTTGAGEGKLSP